MEISLNFSKKYLLLADGGYYRDPQLTRRHWVSDPVMSAHLLRTSTWNHYTWILGTAYRKWYQKDCKSQRTYTLYFCKCNKEEIMNLNGNIFIYEKRKSQKIFKCILSLERKNNYFSRETEFLGLSQICFLT